MYNFSVDNPGLYGSSFLYGNEDFFESHGLTYSQEVQEDWWVSVFVERFLPDYIRKTNPNFVQYVKYFLEFGESYKNPLWVIGHLAGIYDIDRTLPEMFEKYIYQYAPDLIIGELDIDVRFFIRNIKQFYQIKGTDRAFKFLFRIIGHDAELFYPVDYLFNASDDQLLSDIHRLQDSFYWTFFTYDIRVDKPMIEWEEYIRRLNHPAGFKMFGTLTGQAPEITYVAKSILEGEYLNGIFLASQYSNHYVSYEDLGTFWLREVSIRSDAVIDEGYTHFGADTTTLAYNSALDGHVEQLLSGAQGIIRKEVLASTGGNDRVFIDVTSGSFNGPVSMTRLVGYAQVTYGSAGVVGVGTTFTSFLINGDDITINGVRYTVTTVSDDTNLILSVTYGSVTGDILDEPDDPQATIETGFCTFTNGSNAVVGVGTKFTTQLTANARVAIDGLAYQIDITDDTNAVLKDYVTDGATTYAGLTGEHVMSEIDPITCQGEERPILNFKKSHGYTFLPVSIFDDLVLEDMEENLSNSYFTPPSYMTDVLESGSSRHGLVDKLLYVFSIDKDFLEASREYDFPIGLGQVRPDGVLGNAGTLIHYETFSDRYELHVEIDPPDIQAWKDAVFVEGDGLDIAGFATAYTQTFYLNDILTPYWSFGITVEEGTLVVNKGIEFVDVGNPINGLFGIISGFVVRPIYSLDIGNEPIFGDIIGYSTTDYFLDIKDNLIIADNYSDSDYKLINHYDA